MFVIILGGTHDHIDLIIESKRRGYKTILIDYLKNPPAKKHADLFKRISVLDKDKVLEVAHKYNVYFVVSSNIDIALHTCAYVSEKLGLPFYISSEISNLVTNKLLMKKRMLESKISTSRFMEIKNNSFKQLEIDFPVVVKPVDSNSSKGVFKANNLSDLSRYIDKSRRFSKSDTVLLEEFVEGIEVSIDAIVINKNIQILMITRSNKSSKLYENFVITESIYSLELEKKLSKLVSKELYKIIEAFGIINSPIILQCIYSPDQEAISVIEFSCRFGGGSKNLFIKNIKKIDTISMYLDIVVSQLERKKFNLSSAYNNASIKYLYCSDGVIEDFEGFNLIKEHKSVLDIFYYKSVGDQINITNSSSDRCAGVLFKYSNRSEYSKMLEFFQEKFRVISNHKNILRDL